MASDDQHQDARDLYSQLKKSGDYPPWDEADIAEMFEYGVDDAHIEAEWAYAVSTYNDLRGGPKMVLARCSEMGLDRSNVNEHTVAEWIKQGLSEGLIRLEYIRSTSQLTMNDAAVFLDELERQTRSDLPIPWSKENILVKLSNGHTGKDIALEYAAVQYTMHQPVQVPRLQRSVNKELEDLWVELHYGLLYATVCLPSKPIVLRNLHRVQDQFSTYFAPAPRIDPLGFSGKTVQLMTATVVKLDKILDQRTKEGGHPKALNTMFTTKELKAYRSIRATIKIENDSLDVEDHSQLWRFLKDLAAKLHPELAKPQQDASKTPVQPPSETTEESRYKLRRWTDAERHALWRCINTWCKEHGVDQFAADNIDTDTWQAFATTINAVSAGQGGGIDRTAETVLGQVRDAIRRDISVANRPIYDLGVRARKMAEDIKEKKVIPKSVRYPDEAISMVGIP